MTALGLDVRYAVRALRLRPLFATMTILTLGIAIGGATAIFSVMNAALLRPLPFREPGQLVRVSLTTPDDADMVWSYPKYEVLRDRQRVFASIGAYAQWTGDLTGDGEPERLRGEMVTDGYFDVLGIAPSAGRTFTVDEARNPGASRVVVIGAALRDRRFGPGSDVVGRTIQLDGRPATIVGVMPATFRGLTGLADVFVPITEVGEMLRAPQAHFMTVVARLRSETGIDQARSEVGVLGKRIDDLYRSPRDNTTMMPTVRPLDAVRVDPAIRRAVLVLFGAVTSVVLLACVNIANLLLTRAAGRRREIAVRRAIGAGSARLVRQLLTESLVLAIAGGIVGIAIAWVGVHAFSAMAANVGDVLGRNITGLDAITLASIRIDATVLMFALSITVITGLLFGAAPVLGAARANITNGLGFGTTSSGRFSPGRNSLVVLQIAIAFVLLVGSGLMLRSLGRLLDTDAGVNPRNLLTVRLDLPASQSPEQLANFWQNLSLQASALPGASSAAIADCPPLTGRCNVRPLWLGEAGASIPQPVGVHYIEGDYARAVGSAVKQGRAFDARDRAGSPNVVLINETAARRFFPGEDPIGRRIAVGGGFADGADIIGVVADQRFDGPATPAEPDVYIAYDQVPQAGGYLMLRTSGDPVALIPSVRALVQRLNPNLPIRDVKTMEQRVSLATARVRITGLLLAGFAMVALLLALLGTYAVAAASVNQRASEIGVRIAIGAAPRDVAFMILEGGAALVAAGIGVGLLGAFGITRVLRSMLYETTPTEPVVLGAMAATVAAVALVAITLPAVRATRVDPVRTLKAEA